MKSKKMLSRREFMKLSGASAAGLALVPGWAGGMTAYPEPMKRRFGKTDFEVTTFGLGGQSSIQWTPEDVDPVDIILKAFELKVNYFDTSNVYGPSQINYGKAFQKLNLIPGRRGYDQTLRSSLFLTTKTMVRWATGGYPEIDGVRNSTQGDPALGAVGDVKRSLSQMFGDGNGGYPQDAYLDMVMIHNLNRSVEVDVVYQGLEGDPDREGQYGALIALRDFRDGTNITGLNPGRERLIRHIGFSGHNSSPVMMEMIQRDQFELLDGMLVAINVNDRRYTNMQYNVIPPARARDIGVVGMKVFADAAMYHKAPGWSRTPEDVYRGVGSAVLPSKPLIEYALTTPGMDTLIIGIGQIDEDPLKCQLVQNFYAAQIREDALGESRRRELEHLGLRVHEGKANYFQQAYQGLTPPRNPRVTSGRNRSLLWDTSIAGDEPVVRYEIIEDGRLIESVPHTPQLFKDRPFGFSNIRRNRTYSVVAVDAAGRKAASQLIRSG